MPKPILARPATSDYASYYEPYVQLAPAGDLLEALENQGRDQVARWRALPASAAGFAYGEGKWTVEEVIGHVVDIERVFGFRAMCFLRGMTEALPGVDQDIMVPRSRSNERGIHSLAAEFEGLRASHVELFGCLTEEDLAVRGQASGTDITVGALLTLIYGHVQHHGRVLEERYVGALKP